MQKNNTNDSLHITWQQYRMVIIILLLGIFLTGMAIQFQKKYEFQQIKTKLALRASDEAAHIQQTLYKTYEVMESIRNFYAASQFVDRNEFRLFVKSQLLVHPEIRALEWIPLVTHEQRANLEIKLSKIIPGRRITEQNSAGELVPAAKRSQYFPVYYVEPLQGNEPALGYDISSNPVRAQALKQAMDTGAISLSNKINLVQEKEIKNGVLLFQPIYKNTQDFSAASNKQDDILGFALGVIDPKALIISSIKRFSPTGLDVMLVNHNNHASAEILHFHQSRTRKENIPQPTVDEFISDLHYEIDMNITGANWHLYFRPTQAFFREFNSIQVIVILFSGIVLTGLLAFNLTRRIHYTQDALHKAQHDALTGLPNRLLFKQRLSQVISTQHDSHISAILFLDLDNFKNINDSLGHAVGDQILIDVALRLRNHTRAQDVVARMGGDEFIILIQYINNQDDIASLVKKLLKSITSPYHVDGRIFYLSASVGISVYPFDAQEPDALISNADAAMYRAKSRGRNTFDFYSADLTTQSMQRMQQELDLREAVKNQLLNVYYQPQIDLVSMRVIGAEALARWTHKEFGDISPSQFIPVAEDSGLIVEIGEWILWRSCEQAKIWLNSGITNFTIAVNISAFQLQRSDFVATVKNVLESTGLPAENLELELTESVIMQQAEQAIDILIELGKLGVSLAIDDFGTGHSSLAYLKRLPIDKLKIDRSFIQDLPDDDEDVAITSAIIALSNSLGLQVTAEGVETQAQKDFLMQMGCTEAQGFYFSKPVPADKFPLSTDGMLKIIKEE